ncbi:leucine-rich repeat domain-containing protein [Pseudomonas aeruginosa]|uniref:leucine-rich repeat domain-containing protein n=1 Tax=Pseudomonas aeruginosa TaxID=287 RepID=UPI000A911913|nr:leucine-rich repeat domain-containing protein [Pseudomonas aeruginosa]
MHTLQQLRSGELAGATRLDLSCGLREFPREIFELADSLEVLNLSGNALDSLPDDLGRLHRLKVLFCSANDFDELPAAVGDCPALSMVGFKSNRIERVPAAALPPALRWLILTDNRIATLPEELGRRPLQKLMLAGNRLDVIGTDHAPHAWAEKQQAYPQAPAGLPLVQHALPALLELVREGWLSLATLVAKTSHRVAELFAIADRGFLREGYWADLVLVSELEHPALASAMPLLSRCNWTPFRHRAFHHRIDTTIVSGQLAWHAGRLSDDCQGLPLRFSR